MNGLLLENWRIESWFARTMLLHTSLWLQWLLCVTVALNGLITSIFWIGTIWLFSVPNMTKRLAGKYYRTNDEVTSAVQDFFEDQDESFYNMESKRCNTDGRSVWTAGETIVKNKPHLVKFDHCIIVSLWTFQPTLTWQNLDDFMEKWFYTYFSK